MGLKYKFHKWPFEQQKQIIPQLIFQFSKETQIKTFPPQRVRVWPHTRWMKRWPRGQPQCARASVLPPVHSANLLRAAAELEFCLRSRLTTTFRKGNQKERWRTRVKQTNKPWYRPGEPEWNTAWGNPEYPWVLHARSSFLFQSSVQLITPV